MHRIVRPTPPAHTGQTTGRPPSLIADPPLAGAVPVRVALVGHLGQQVAQVLDQFGRLGQGQLGPGVAGPAVASTPTSGDPGHPR